MIQGKDRFSDKKLIEILKYEKNKNTEQMKRDFIACGKVSNV